MMIISILPLRPLASPQPSRMHSAVEVSDISVGRFVFFSIPNSIEVKAGIVQTIQDGKVTVEEHQQGSTLRRKFAPSTVTLLTIS